MGFGTKVVVGYSAFVVLIVGLVVFSFSQDFHLEDENYYEKEVMFGDEMKAVQNFNALNNDVEIEQGDLLKFHFPDSLKNDTLNVSLTLKRPNDAKFDQVLEFNQVTSPIVLPTNDLIGGNYNLVFAFQINETPYLRKKTIYLNL